MSNEDTDLLSLRVFSDSGILPAQFFQQRATALEGEEKLMLAIIEISLIDLARWARAMYESNGKLSGPGHVRLRNNAKDAAGWFMADKVKPPYVSFPRACAAVFPVIDIGRFRRAVKTYVGRILRGDDVGPIPRCGVGDITGII